jgi:hypothetical protein
LKEKRVIKKFIAPKLAVCVDGKYVIQAYFLIYILFKVNMLNIKCETVKWVCGGGGGGGPPHAMRQLQPILNLYPDILKAESVWAISCCNYGRGYSNTLEGKGITYSMDQ